MRIKITNFLISYQFLLSGIIQFLNRGEGNLFAVIDTKYLTTFHMLIVLPPLELINFCSERPTGEKKGICNATKYKFPVKTLLDISSLSYDLLVADCFSEITGFLIILS